MKTCQSCGFVPTKEEEMEPSGGAENCPQCGGINTVMDDGATAEEGGMQEE